MATGTVHQSGGVASPADLPFAGAAEWSAMTGVSPMSPLVGGPGLAGGGGQASLPYNVDGARSRVVTNGTAGPVGAADAAGMNLLDDWRDVFNFRGSPAPWLLLFILVMLGLMQLRVSARAGKAKGNIALG
jgi:hypothetical protein